MRRQKKAKQIMLQKCKERLIKGNAEQLANQMNSFIKQEADMAAKNAMKNANKIVDVVAVETGLSGVGTVLDAYND